MFPRYRCCRGGILDRLKVKPVLQGRGHLVDALVPGVGGTDNVEAGPCKEEPPVSQLGDIHDLVTENTDKAVLNLGGGAGNLLEPGQKPFSMPTCRGAGTRASRQGPLASSMA